MYRCVTNKSLVTVEQRTIKMVDHLNNLRKFLQKSGDGRWGAFPPEKRYNLDQIGLEPFPDRSKTITVKGASRVHMNMGGPGKARR